MNNRGGVGSNQYGKKPSDELSQSDLARVRSLGSLAVPPSMTLDSKATSNSERMDKMINDKSFSRSEIEHERSAMNRDLVNGLGL